ncbi:MAG TPA: cytochrome P460 family protein [Bryobacteraceae bacterium]|nr:cytochrome P460 family protein [Bryobacteraceae bacterium]
MTRISITLLLGAALLAQTGGAIQYNKDGSMVLPTDYREWVFLSSGINMTYGPAAGTNDHPRFENVFVNPASYQAFLKTGTWPDKTAMILEVRDSDSKVSINKDGRVQTQVAAIEAHAKDSSRGGWAFYAFHDGGPQGTPFPKTADCFSCHQQNGAVDSTFVQFYPTLIDVARKHGTYKATAE